MKQFVISSILYVIAIIIGLIGTFTPYWTEETARVPDTCRSVEEVTVSGIWVKHRDLQLAKENVTERDSGGWKTVDGKTAVHAVRGLMIAGVACLCVYFIIAAVVRCCMTPRKGQSYSGYYCWTGFVGGLLMDTGVLVFRNHLLSPEQKLVWGFWFAAASSLIALTTGIVDTIIGCCMCCRNTNTT